MKSTIIYLLVFSFFFQSCTSYKDIELKETKLVVGKKYKIKQDANFVKVKLEKVNDSTLTVLEGNVKKNIAVSDIKEIKVRKVSAVKTVFLSVGILAGAVLVIAVAAVAAFAG